MKKLVIVAIVLVATGCASMSTDLGAYKQGTLITQAQMDALQPGSTQDMVVTQVGHPTKKDAVHDRELWYYDYQIIRHIGPRVSESTVFEFDAAGKLIKSYKAGKATKTGNPLLDAAAQ